MKYLYIPFEKSVVRKHPEISTSIEQCQKALKADTIVYHNPASPALAGISSADTICLFSVASPQPFRYFDTKLHPATWGYTQPSGKVGFYKKTKENPNQEIVSLNQKELAKRLWGDLEKSEDSLYLNIELLYLKAKDKIKPLSESFRAQMNEVTEGTAHFKVQYSENLELKESIENDEKKYQLNGYEQKHTLYTTPEASPRLTREHIDIICKAYKAYKSNRLYGLSGKLHLNRFFSSAASLNMIKQFEKILENNHAFDYKTQDKIYKKCSQFVQLLPKTKLSELINEAITEADKANDQLFTPQKTLSNTI